jgi:hypothetical protein
MPSEPEPSRIRDSSQMPPWLDFLAPNLKEWRQREIEKARNPDPFIEKHLRRVGIWPENAPHGTTRQA